jgi:hypothetical protein
MHRHLLTCILTVSLIGVIGLLVWGYDRSQTVKWIGSTNLAVEFIVTDAHSGLPIPGARVQIRGRLVRP